VYEDDAVLAFHDIHPVAPVHFLIVPKRHIASLAALSDSDVDVMGRIMVLTGKLAREQGCPNGFRTIVNTGQVGRQDVMHVHVHVIGGTEVLPPMIVRKG
jgi:histidine triad (HIT) family protein